MFLTLSEFKANLDYLKQTHRILIFIFQRTTNSLQEHRFKLRQLTNGTEKGNTGYHTQMFMITIQEETG